MTKQYMIPDEMSLNRAFSLINDWHEYLAGNQEIRDTYPPEYIASNLVGQIKRIERLKLTDKRCDEVMDRFSSLLESSRDELVLSSLKGAEPDSLRSLLGSVWDSISTALRLEESPELEPDLCDQITDCLVRRDDLYLIENFVRSEIVSLGKDARTSVFELLEKYVLSLAQIDKEFKENIDVFALVSEFCSTYIGANNITDQNTYWWLFEPISTADEANIVSLLSLRSFLPKSSSDTNILDLTAYVNARTWQKKLESENKVEKQAHESSEAEIFELHVERPAVELGYSETENPEYALAARSEEDTELQPAVYMLAVNVNDGNPEFHRIVGLVGSDQKLPKYLGADVQDIVDHIPATAEANHKIPWQKFSIKLQTTFEGCSGESIGLAAYLEYLRAVGFLVLNRPVAATGVLEYSGTITRVEDVNLKVELATKQQFPLILIPRENESDLKEELKHSASIRFVENVREAVNTLRISSTHESANAHPAIDELNGFRLALKPEGFDVSEVKEGTWHYFIEVTGLGDKAKLIIDYNSKGFVKSPRVQGRPGSPLVLGLNNLISKQSGISGLDTSGKLLRGKVVILKPEVRNQIRDYLTRNFRAELQAIDEKGCEYRVDVGRRERIVIKQFPNGTLTLDGRESTLWNQVVSAIETVSELKLPIYSADNQDSKKKDSHVPRLPSDVTSWIGIDEAGKGDYFGPLVTAAVLVDPSNREKLSELGIRDSKALSDQKNVELGLRILEICQDKCYVLTTMPEKYNQLMAEPSFQGNSQRVLGWQHRRALENILSNHECQHAICDQFGAEYFVREGLKTGKGTQIEILQRPKAESDLAVAAASILARREYLSRLQKMSTEYGIVFPKGSSDFETILKTAQNVIGRFGQEILAKVAKVHFKTTKRILDEIQL